MKNQKLVLAAIGIAGVLGVASYALTLQGPGVDFFSSKILSRKLHTTVICNGAALRQWKKINFNFLKIHLGHDTGPVLETGPGEVQFFQSGAQIHLSNSKLSSLPDVLQRFLTNGSLNIEKSETFLTVRQGRLLTLHIRRCKAKNFILKGGLQWNGEELIKAHGVILTEENHRKEFRFFYRPNYLIIKAGKKPLFQANWRF